MIAELNVYASADRVLTVSQKEADLINDILAREAHAIAVPDAKEMPPAGFCRFPTEGAFSSSATSHTRRISMPSNSFPSKSSHTSIRRFWKRHPIKVVGNALTDAVRALCDRPGMEAIGWVPSVTPYFEEARVFGRPAPNWSRYQTEELIKAVLSGLPTVSTPIGVEGLALSPGKGVIVEADPREFARSVERLLRNDVLWAQTANGGRDGLMAVHAREAVSLRLHEALDLSTSTGNLHVAPAPPLHLPEREASRHSQMILPGSTRSES